MKPKVTLVVLANEKQARFLVNRGIGKGLEEVASVEASAVVGPEVEFADGPGRSRAAPGMARHSVAPRTSEEELERQVFADHVADRAEAIWRKNSFDRLVLAAPPKMLGLLRDTLSEAMMGRLEVDLAKDLLKVPARDLPKHFEDHILF